MEPEVTTKNFEVRFSDCDHHSRLKLSNLFLFMEETAIADAEQNGFGIWKMMKAGYTTVITRLKIRLLHHPVWGEKLSISTWAKDIIKDKVCLKDYSILDAQGHSIAQATSSWLLVNMKTGKAENPANAPYPIPLIQGKNALPEMMDILDPQVDPQIVATEIAKYEPLPLCGLGDKLARPVGTQEPQNPFNTDKLHFTDSAWRQGEYRAFQEHEPSRLHFRDERRRHDAMPLPGAHWFCRLEHSRK